MYSLMMASYVAETCSWICVFNIDIIPVRRMYCWFIVVIFFKFIY